VALINPTDIALAAKMSMFLNTQPDKEGNTGWTRFFGWIAGLDEKLQQEFLDMLSGGEQIALTSELTTLVTKMQDKGMDVATIAADILDKKVSINPIG
jgi:hypothetical protein